jgi:hypothetical protein
MQTRHIESIHCGKRRGRLSARPGRARTGGQALDTLGADERELDVQHHAHDEQRGVAAEPAPTLTPHHCDAH